MPKEHFYIIDPAFLVGGILIGGVLFVLLCVFVGRYFYEFEKAKVGIVGFLAYSSVMLILMIGPLWGKVEIRQYRVTWEIIESPEDEKSKTEVVFSFIDYPPYKLHKFSDDLADHLRSVSQEEIELKFELIWDLTAIRSWMMIEVDGLTEWDQVPISRLKSEDPMAVPPWKK